MLDFIRGAVRPILAILFGLALTILEGYSVIALQKDLSAAYLGVAGGAIGWYFYSRQKK